jgi:glyoxylase-like metal-dependent hydrolase (beta-lactamase superfamily II)
MSNDATDPLKLIAFDGDDLAVLSAHLQDAVLKVGDIAYLPAEKRFALAARRFDWQAAQAGPRRRRLSALHFERVTAARSTKIDAAAPAVILNLLAITFEEEDAPAGQIILHFSDGAAIRLDVECIEAQMKDLGPVWEAIATPGHPDDA